MTRPPDKRQPLPGASAYDDVQVDLTVLAFRGLVPTIVASILGSGGTTALLAFEYRDVRLTFLAVTVVALCAVRLIQALTFRVRDAARLNARRARSLQNAYGVFTLLYCCTISLIVLYFARLHSVQGLIFSLIGVFCICIGLAARTGTSPWIPQSSGGVLLAAMAYSVLQSDLRFHWIGSAAILFFAYQFFYTIHNQFRTAVEQLRTRRQLRILSEQDTLTGLANRRHFEASLAALCASGEPFAVLFIDLDRFKQVNDTHGHAVGDILLIEVSHRLAADIRSSDLLARLGGDEFAILQTPLLSADAAGTLAARINHDIAQPFVIAGHDLQIGASIGVRLSGNEAIDANTLLTKADQALYKVKQAGGGGFSLATA